MELNQEELRKEEDQIYKYAANLMINEKWSAIDTKDELVRKGLRPEAAFFIIDHIDEQIRKQKEEKAHSYYIRGLLFLCLGFIATAVTRGSHVYYGAILLGVGLIIKGKLTK